MNKAKFKEELSNRVPPYYVNAESTVGGYHGMIPASNGLGEIVDYDVLWVLSADKDNHLIASIGHFRNELVVIVRIEIPDQDAMSYPITTMPSDIWDNMEEVRLKEIIASPYYQDAVTIMQAIYESYIIATN